MLNEVQSKEKQVIIVLDKSISMLNGNRIDKVKYALSRWLGDAGEVPIGSELGLVSFNHESKMEFEIQGKCYR